MLVELRLGGGGKAAQTIFPGSIHESGEPIEWVREGEPATVDCATLLAAAARLAAASLLLRRYPTAGGRHEFALVVGGFLARAGLTRDIVEDVAWSIARAANDEEADDRMRAATDTFDAFARGDGAVYGFPKLCDAIGEPFAKAIAKFLNYDGDDARPVRFSGDEVAPAASEEALALEFAVRHAGALRYVAMWGHWLVWGGSCWREDQSRSVFDLARRICREAAVAANGRGKALASAKTRAAVVSLASDDRRLAATIEQFDANQKSFNERGD
jgi:hypothetical protein